MNPTQAFLAHIANQYAVSGDAPPTADQWREIKEKFSNAMLYQITGTLEGIGDMNKVTEATVPVSC